MLLILQLSPIEAQAKWIIFMKLNIKFKQIRINDKNYNREEKIS